MIVRSLEVFFVRFHSYMSVRGMHVLAFHATLCCSLISVIVRSEEATEHIFNGKTIPLQNIKSVALNCGYLRRKDRILKEAVK